MRGIKSSRVGRRNGSGLWAGLLGCLLASTAPAQVFVSHLPAPSAASDNSRNGVYTEEELQANPRPTNESDLGEALSPEETARRIEEYRREAGPVGPNRWFSSVRLDLGASLAVAYDDNIRVTNNRSKEGDEITTIGGRVVASLGDYVERQGSFVFVDYSLWGNLFAKYGDQDSLDQNGTLDALYRQDRLSLESVSRVVIDHDATSDVTARQSNEDYDETLALRYHYSDKTTLNTIVRVNLNNSEFGQDNQQYTINEAIDYQFSDRTSLGFGLLFGRLNSGDGLHENFESPTVRATYRVAEKISVSGALGVDIRERGAPEGTGATPVFVLESQWTPYEGTSLFLSGFRRVDASESLGGEDFTSTNLALSLEKRVFEHYSVVDSVDYSHNDYTVVNGRGINAPARTDDYYFFRIGLTYKALKYFEYGLYYRRQENDSNLGIYTYASNRVSLQCAFLY